jgi:hypothetical protein
MQLVISNKSKLTSAPNRIVVSNNNNIGRVIFSKITNLVGSIGLQQLNNVVTTGQQEGDVLVYQANNNTYVIKTLPDVDGGLF